MTTQSLRPALSRIASTPTRLFAAASLFTLAARAQTPTAPLPLLASNSSSSSANSLPDAPPTPNPISRPAGPSRPRKHNLHQTDLSVGISTNLTATRTVPAIAYTGLLVDNTVGSSPAPALLLTLHQQLHPWIGFNANAGYARPTINYSPFDRNLSIGTNAYELTGSFVAKAPLTRSRIQPFVQGGGGMLAFVPTKNSIPLPTDPTATLGFYRAYRAATLFGAGTDLRLDRHLSLRVEYRGLFYKSPDLTHDEAPASKAFTVTSQPTVSLTYRFGVPSRGMQ